MFFFFSFFFLSGILRRDTVIFANGICGSFCFGPAFTSIFLFVISRYFHTMSPIAISKRKKKLKILYIYLYIKLIYIINNYLLLFLSFYFYLLLLFDFFYTQVLILNTTNILFISSEFYFY
jgi:hypothetical protein